jgi:hypothetical protein
VGPGVLDALRKGWHGQGDPRKDENEEGEDQNVENRELDLLGLNLLAEKFRGLYEEVNK